MLSGHGVYVAPATVDREWIAARRSVEHIAEVPCERFAGRCTVHAIPPARHGDFLDGERRCTAWPHLRREDPADA
jgi:hypothetical protein